MNGLARSSEDPVLGHLTATKVYDGVDHVLA